MEHSIILIILTIAIIATIAIKKCGKKISETMYTQNEVIDMLKNIKLVDPKNKLCILCKNHITALTNDGGTVSYCELCDLNYKITNPFGDGKKHI